jgi:hypothetical protein
MCNATSSAAAAVAGVEEDDTINGTAIMTAFKTLNFTGASGTIQMNEETASRTTNDFVVWNMKQLPTETNNNTAAMSISYGIYPSLHYHQQQQEGQLQGWSVVGTNDFVFANSSNTPPNSLPDVKEDHHYVETLGRAIAYFPMVIIMGCSIASLLWMFWHRQSRAIRSAQPLFLSMISVGSLVTVSTIIPMGLDDQIISSQHGLNLACQAGPWLYVIGSCCSYSALTAKVRGVYEVRSNNKKNTAVETNNSRMARQDSNCTFSHIVRCFC